MDSPRAVWDLVCMGECYSGDNTDFVMCDVIIFVRSQEAKFTSPGNLGGGSASATSDLSSLILSMVPAATSVWQCLLHCTKVVVRGGSVQCVATALCSPATYRPR